MARIRSIENKTFADNLRNLMHTKQCKQKDIAEACGVCEAQVSNWINGINKPNCNALVRLAEYFGTTPIALFRKAPSQFHNDERFLLHSFRTLNAEGQKQALKYIEFLKGDYSYEKEVIAKGV